MKRILFMVLLGVATASSMMSLSIPVSYAQEAPPEPPPKPEKPDSD
jgi:hypothetical protein